MLEAEDLPIGVVTGIAAQLRLKAVFKGVAGHAGTSPMHLRHDAVAAAAQSGPDGGADLQGGPAGPARHGRPLPLSTTAFNVIAGETEIGIDLRAATNVVRDRGGGADPRGAARPSPSSAASSCDFTVVQDLSACPW